MSDDQPVPDDETIQAFLARLVYDQHGGRFVIPADQLGDGLELGVMFAKMVIDGRKVMVVTAHFPEKVAQVPPAEGVN